MPYAPTHRSGMTQNADMSSRTNVRDLSPDWTDTFPIGPLNGDKQSIVSKHRSEFWSKLAANYDRVVDLQIGPQTRSLVRQRLHKEGQLGNVAEFGCGTGYYTQVLAEKAETVIATDLSPGMLDLAKQQITAGNVK